MSKQTRWLIELVLSLLFLLLVFIGICYGFTALAKSMLQPRQYNADLTYNYQTK